MELHKPLKSSALEFTVHLVLLSMEFIRHPELLLTESDRHPVSLLVALKQLEMLLHKHQVLLSLEFMLLEASLDRLLPDLAGLVESKH